MNGFDARLLSIDQAAEMYLAKNKIAEVTVPADEDGGMSFDEILNKKVDQKDNVRFSKHANQRLESRNIILSNEQIDRLNQGIDRARDKRINESLVMMDNLAFIVNIKNNTVVTALEQNEDSVFTNIDGAVIV
ncbi:MAG: TIGR02530 family flagellar biosynthesis protein [Wujia sp.]